MREPGPAGVDVCLGIRQSSPFCALQHRPDVLVLDEPSSGVEPLGRGAADGTRSGSSPSAVWACWRRPTTCRRRSSAITLLLMFRAAWSHRDRGDIVDGTTAVAVASDDWARSSAVLMPRGWS